MTRRDSCDVCGLPFLRHQAAEEKVPPATRHRYTTTRQDEPPRRAQEGLDLTTHTTEED